MGTSEIMLCRGTTRSTHDSDWKKGLLPGSFTWPLKMYPPKRKERITNQHFSRARKLHKLNYIQFHGYIHMSSAHKSDVSFELPGECFWNVEGFLSTGWQVRNMEAFLWRKIPLQNISTLWVFRWIFWKSWTLVFTGPYDIFWCQPRSAPNFWTSEKTTNPEIAELQWSVRWHNQDTTDAGKWGIYWDSGTKILWMRHS